MSDSQRTAGKTATEISLLGVGVLLAVALLVGVNYFGWKYHQRFDWTASEFYSLSEKSEQVLSELDRDINIVVFMSRQDPLSAPVLELLAQYEAASRRITLREVDPDRNLAEAQALVDRYGIDSVNVVLFESDGDRRLVEADDLAEYDYSGMQFGQPPRMTGFKGEQSFTSALLELGERQQAKVVFTTGHGELQLSDFSPSGLSGAQELLERDNFLVESWASLGATEVPADANLVVIAGPTGNFLPPEAEALAHYLEAGGSLLVLLDPTLSAAGDLVDTGLSGFLSRYGVVVGEDIVVDPANPLPFFGADTLVVDNFGRHAITQSLDQAQLPTILPLARSVDLESDLEGFETSVLLRTSSEGWGETNLGNLTAIERDDADVEGPVALAVAVEAVVATAAAADSVAGDPESATEDSSGTPLANLSPSSHGERLVVVGDATFASNAQLRNVGNLTLLANMLNWLVERESLLGIGPKTPEDAGLNLTASDLRRIFWLVIVGLPLLAVAIGIFVHRRRRS